MRFVFSVCRLISQRCHNISSISELHSSPSQNRASSFPTHGSSICHSASFRLSVSDLCSLLIHSLHSGSVSSSTDDRSWGPSLSGHYPTSSLTVTAYRSPSLATRPFEPLFSHWCSYSGICLTLLPKSPSSLAWLLACRCAARCCLRLRGGSWHSSLARFLHGLRPL
jgi:hypothetical protein